MDGDAITGFLSIAHHTWVTVPVFMAAGLTQNMEVMNN